MNIKLGQKAKDKITGFTGILVGKAEYLYGCNQYGIAPECVNGEVKDTHWFDEGRIEVVGNGILPEEVRVKKDGGPNRDSPKI